MANPSTTIDESDAAAVAANFYEVAAAFPPLLAAIAAAAPFFCAAFFLLVSDCEKRKNLGERQILKKERINKKMRGERKVE